MCLPFWNTIWNLAVAAPFLWIHQSFVIDLPVLPKNWCQIYQSVTSITHFSFLFFFFVNYIVYIFPQGSCLLPLICSSNLSFLHRIIYLGTFLFWNIWNILIWNIWVSFLFWNNIIECYKYILFLYNYIIFMLFVIITILIYSYYHLFYFLVCQKGQI